MVNTDDIMFGSRWLTTFFDGELIMIVQPLVKYIFSFDRSFSTSGSDQEMYYGALVVLSKSYEFTANRLNTTYYMVGLANMNPSQSEGWRNLLEIRWKVSDYISTKLYYEWYNGDHMGVYGAYDKHDNVGLYIKYEF